MTELSFELYYFIMLKDGRYARKPDAPLFGPNGKSAFGFYRSMEEALRISDAGGEFVDRAITDMINGFKTQTGE